VNVTVIDPESIDRPALDAKLQYLNTVVSPPLAASPISVQAAAMRSGNFDFKDMPIGTIEIVEVSDLVAGATPDSSTMGFDAAERPGRRIRAGAAPIGSRRDSQID
jgi:hypothetical protein